MYKLMIADDEYMIRRGLKNSLDWNSMNIDVIGEAEDGEIALELVKKTKPDMILLDICMPFLNGLELIKKLNEEAKNTLIIIITGHDEFKYIQEALKLKVFDYILKPVNKNDLKATVDRAVQELDKLQTKNEYFNWAKNKLNENMNVVKENIFNDLIKGNLSNDQVKDQLDFIKLSFNDSVGMTIVKIIDRVNSEVSSNKNMDKDLLKFAIKNIMIETLNNYDSAVVFSDDKDNIIAISNVIDITEWTKAGGLIVENIEKYLGYIVMLEQEKITESIAFSKKTYDELIEIINNKYKYKPVILLTLRYIDSKYYEKDLCLEDVAKKFNITPSYLSKLLKSETGISFVNHITNVRIKKAICIMDDPTVKMYDVAELVGYSNQYYFSKAFKKVKGFSPAKYKEGKID